jgi:RHS repeat-associated protein
VMTWTGVTLSYGYDCAGNVAWVSTGSASTTECSTLSDSDPAAPIGSSVVSTSYGFDPASGMQTSQATTAGSGSTNLLSFALGYDPMGRLNSSTPTKNSTVLNTDTYGFDTDSRVNSGPIAGTGSTSYSYTPANDVKADTNNFATAGYAPAGELCWTSTTSGSSACSSTPSPETSFAYNTDEERTASTPPSGGNPESLGWNTSQQELSCVNTDGTTCSTSSPTSTTTLYTYNAEGLRQSATNQGATNSFTWSAMNQQLLADSTHDYIYGVDQTTPIMQIETSGFLTTPTVDLLIDDANHNVRGVVQLQGDSSSSNYTIVNYTDYDAYGNPITESGGLANVGGLFGTSGTTEFTSNFGFGSSYEDLSNFDYLVNRYYDPITGQFVSLDPEVSSTQDPYQYADDAPMSNFDPTGLSAYCIDRNTEHYSGDLYGSPNNACKKHEIGLQITALHSINSGGINFVTMPQSCNGALDYYHTADLEDCQVVDVVTMFYKGGATLSNVQMNSNGSLADPDGVGSIGFKCPICGNSLITSDQAPGLIFRSMGQVLQQSGVRLFPLLIPTAPDRDGNPVAGDADDWSSASGYVESDGVTHRGCPESC